MLLIILLVQLFNLAVVDVCHRMCLNNFFFRRRNMFKHRQYRPISESTWCVTSSHGLNMAIFSGVIPLLDWLR